MKPYLLAVFSIVPACTETSAILQPPPDTPYVEVSVGGAFSGGSDLRIWATDVIEESSYGPFGEHKRKPSLRPAKPGTYDAVYALVKKDLPRLNRQGRDDVCEDYGGDVIEVSPPVNGVGRVMFLCPNERMTALIGKIDDLLSEGE